MLENSATDAHSVNFGGETPLHYVSETPQVAENNEPLATAQPERRSPEPLMVLDLSGLDFELPD
eukprot:m.466849 g.466849  ORF g.466849 m.466849 type:complete len:64 (+) comp57062_c0_seq23:683-874(+)